DSPSDVRSVVLEVDGTDAQKLLLASQVGTLSLVLRNAGEPRLQNTRRIGVSDLVETENAQPEGKASVVSLRVVRIGSKASGCMVPKEWSELAVVPHARAPWIRSQASLIC